MNKQAKQLLIQILDALDTNGRCDDLIKTLEELL